MYRDFLAEKKIHGLLLINISGQDTGASWHSGMYQELNDTLGELIELLKLPPGNSCVCIKGAQPGDTLDTVSIPVALPHPHSTICEHLN